MGNTQSSQHTCIDWLAKGPLAPHVDALATVGRALQHHRAVARTREHEYYPSIRRSRLGDEGKGTRQTGSTRHQVATIPCARLAHEVSSDAVTMQRMRRHLMSGTAGPARSSRHNYA